MTVAENFALALRYGADPQDDAAGDWQHALQLALELCGLSAERIQGIGRQRPIGLDRDERWLIGFVRNLMRPPELLVLDRVFGGLSRRQAETIVALEALYHDFHPFRPTLFVDIDSHELPALPDCVNRLELEMLACPC
jgi:ABC-type ATPase involved in cell division